ncbi:MAG TPA: PKD domain-containing protein [Thermoplasmata archaeon]|nr:PKD domain-containing protein [Thermoplasmata archaeon]
MDRAHRTRRAALLAVVVVTTVGGLIPGFASASGNHGLAVAPHRLAHAAGSGAVALAPVPSGAYRSSGILSVSVHQAVNKRVNMTQVGIWKDVDPASLGNVLPKSRAGNLLVYMPKIHGDVMFGGYSNFLVPFNDTWIWKSGNWTHLVTSKGTNIPAPSPRVGFGMTYDAADGYVVLFGGYSNSLYGDTWTFNGTNWSKCPAQNGTPPAMNAANLVYDAADGYVLLTGGTTYPIAALASAVDYNTTWKFAACIWTNNTSNVTGGYPKSGGAYRTTVYDGTDGYVVMFGGEVPASACTGLNVTYKYKAGVWSKITGTILPGATQGSGGVMAWDPDAHGVFMDGGLDDSCNLNSGTWVFSGGSWHLVRGFVGSTPGGQYLGGMTYDSFVGAIVMFGGNNAGSSGTLNFPRDTWNYTIPFDDHASFSPTQGPIPLSVTFNATPSNGTAPYSYNWTFGDGTTVQKTQNTTHTYLTQGRDTVILRVNDSKSKATISSGFVNVFGLPNVTPLNGDAPIWVTFTSPAYAGVAPFTVHWQFGDNNSNSSTVNITHRYAKGGNYTWNYSMVDVQRDYVNVTGYVNITPQLGLTAIFATPSRHSIPDSVAFVAQPIGGHGPYFSNWSFGDNSMNQSGYTASHTYTSVGTFTARFSIHDSRNQWVNRTLTIQTAYAVTAQVQESVALGVAPLNVQFSIAAAGGFTPYSANWTFGPPGATGSGTAAQYNYTIPGVYRVFATVNDSAGDQTVATGNVTVIAPLTATIAANRTSGPFPLTVGFTTVPTGGFGTNPTINWTFGDNTNASNAKAAISHTYTKAGRYTASVTVTDTAGDTFSKSIGITVVPPLAVRLGGNATRLTTGSTVILTAAATGGGGQITYTWGGLPPGCTTRNSSSLACTPTQAGNYTIVLTVHDTIGDWNNASFSISVTQPPPPPKQNTTPTGGRASGLPLMWIIIGVVVVAIAGAAAAIALRRRGGGGPPRSDDEYSDEAPPAEEEGATYGGGDATPPVEESPGDSSDIYSGTVPEYQYAEEPPAGT